MTIGRPPRAVPVTEIGRRVAGFRIVSCDIFDTAVTRLLARPEDTPLAVGARMQARGVAHCTPEAFREYRLEAERAARASAEASGHDEVRIAEVYDRLQACGVVVDAAAAAATEFAVERAVCRPVEHVRAALTVLAPAQRLVFVSDSMLPGAWLALLLEDCGFGTGLEVYSSADTRRSKHTGRLFARVVADLGCSAGDIIHIGDNQHADIAQARAAGITALLLPRAHAAPEPDAVAATQYPVRLAHSYRRSRIVKDKVPSSLHLAFTMLLIGFTLHVLAEARRRGIRRIYFLARDGYLPLLLARRLIARSGEAIELRYLQVSRQSIVLPSCIDDPASLVPDIAAGLQGRPLDTALEFAGVDAETTAALLRGIGLDPGPCRTATQAVECVGQLLATNSPVVTEHLRKWRGTALAYLAQEGFLEAGPRLIVDVGWRGTTQVALGKLAGIEAADIAGCYLGLWPAALRPGLDPSTASGYLFTFGHPKRLHDIVREGFILLEMVFSAPHGTVTHYVQQDGRFVPVHATEPEPGGSRRRAALAALEAQCLEEFDTLDDILGGAWPELFDPASAIFDATNLLTRPTVREVKAINAVPFINAVNGHSNGVAVNPIGLRQLLLDTTSALRRIDTAPWRSGSIRLALPWPLPAMTYPELAHRIGQLRQLIGRS
jgi:FMN phosphatase YigB (HAD superfamily)